MARSDDETARYKGYGTPYLTPSQELDESLNLGQRALEARVSANPLAQRDAAALAAVAPSAPATITSAVPAPGPNPLVGPPVPLTAMGTDQRIAWQQLQDTQRANQMALETGGLEADIKRQSLETRAEQIRQNRELATHIPKLREALSKDPGAYLDLRADLASKYALGMGSPESDRIFSELERIYTKTESVKADLDKAKIARDEIARQKRLDAGYKEAEKLGGDVVREFAARVEKDPEDANTFLAAAQQRNMVSTLQNAGMTREEIGQKYGGGDTGRPFDYQAAGQAPKGKAAVAAERNKASSEWLALDKERESRGGADFDPDHPENTPGWTQAHQDAWKAKLDYMNSLNPQLPGDNRAGVQGMATKYVPYERTLNPTARVAPPAPALAGGRAPAIAAPAKPREKTYRNPQTGKRIALRNGKWEEI